MLASESPGPVRWYYRPVWVLVLLFLVLGPLGLPYLWNSPRFSRRWKIVLTVLEIAYTALCIVETFRIFGLLRDQLTDLDALDTF